MKTYLFKNLKGVILLIPVLILNYTLVPGQGRGFSDAPPCRTDISRNYSVAEANAAIDRAIAAPDFSSARNELLNAYNNLEQVMNYGALQWSTCMTCNPYTPIMIGGPTYMDVANRLVSISRILYARPDYGEFLGLVETMANRFQTDDYCGYYTNNLVDVSKVAGKYEFGDVSPVQRIRCVDPTFVLSTDMGVGGRIIYLCDYLANNERFYWLLGNELIFLDGQGAITTVLIQESVSNYSYWEGPDKENIPAHITHYIKRKNCKDPQFINNAFPKQSAYLGEPPYGGSAFALVGEEYWLMVPNSNQYFVMSNGNLLRYNLCGELLSTAVTTYTTVRNDGKLQWGGYSQLPNGARGNDWYVVWDVAPGAVEVPCESPSWTNSVLPKQDAFLGEPPYGGSPYSREGDKYWILVNGSNQYFIVNGTNLVRYDRCGKLLSTAVTTYTTVRNDGKQQWGGHILFPDGSQGGGWYVIWE